jgi:hypothetical protein
MKQKYLKPLIITGFIIIILAIILIKVNAQDNSEQFRILTEISMDIKYIKDDMSEIKQDSKETKGQITNLGMRITMVEGRQTGLKENIGSITERNNLFSGFAASILLLMLGLQIKRNFSHRNNNGKNTH